MRGRWVGARKGSRLAGTALCPAERLCLSTAPRRGRRQTRLGGCGLGDVAFASHFLPIRNPTAPQHVSSLDFCFLRYVWRCRAETLPRRLNNNSSPGGCPEGCERAQLALPISGGLVCRGAARLALAQPPQNVRRCAQAPGRAHSELPLELGQPEARCPCCVKAWVEALQRRSDEAMAAAPAGRRRQLRAWRSKKNVAGLLIRCRQSAANRPVVVSAARLTAQT